MRTLLVLLGVIASAAAWGADPILTESWDGKCHMWVTGTADSVAFELNVEGLVPGEQLAIVDESAGEVMQSVAKAREDGTFGAALFPQVKGRSSGTETFTLTSAHCRVTVSFPWHL